MSRIDCELGSDMDCIAGYDLAAETFFFHSGREDDRGKPRIRAGHTFRGAPTIAGLEAAIAKASGQTGFAFPEATRGALRTSAASEIVAAQISGRIERTRADALLDLLDEAVSYGEGGDAGA